MSMNYLNYFLHYFLNLGSNFQEVQKLKKPLIM